MKTLAPEDFDPAIVVEELLDGGGAVRLPGLFDAAQVARAREVVMAETADHEFTGSHFNRDDEDAKLQRRVWHLLPKDGVFAEMATQPRIFRAMQAFLGSDFIMGSICASRTMPGFGGQDPHIDYPYWDYRRKRSFPARINASFPLNAQATIPLDPFTEETGATAYRPGSQRTLRYPAPEDDFFDGCARMLGEPGDAILFFGLVWHCAMPNRSRQGRIGILIEYLPKFVTPIENLTGALDEDFLAAADPRLRQLLGLDYPWPSTPPHPPLADDEPKT